MYLQSFCLKLLFLSFSFDFLKKITQLLCTTKAYKKKSKAIYFNLFTDNTIAFSLGSYNGTLGISQVTYVLLGIKSMLVAHKASTLTMVLSLWLTIVLVFPF